MQTNNRIEHDAEYFSSHVNKHSEGAWRNVQKNCCRQLHYYFMGKYTSFRPANISLNIYKCRPLSICKLLIYQYYVYPETSKRFHCLYWTPRNHPKLLSRKILLTKFLLFKGCPNQKLVQNLKHFFNVSYHL